MIGPVNQDSGGLLIGCSWGCWCYNEVVWTFVWFVRAFFFVLKLWLIISSQIPRICSRMTDQSDGPLSKEYVWTLTFFLKRDSEELLAFQSTIPHSTVHTFNFYPPIFKLVLVRKKEYWKRIPSKRNVKRTEREDSFLGGSQKKEQKKDCTT